MISTIDRKRIFIFVAITYGITLALALVVFFNGGLYSRYPVEKTQLASLLLAATMFAPAVANVATRLITREGWSNTFLRPNLRRGWPFYLAAWSLPIMATIAGGVIYYLLFPGKFDLSMPFARQAGVISATDTWSVVMSRTILRSLLYAPITMFVMFGEEFGWRAYLLPKLMPLGPRQAVMVMGAIWAVFHWPFIFMGWNYGLGYWGAPVAGPLLFVLVLIVESAFYAWVTLRTGSVWPACIAHAAGNFTGPLMVYFLRGEWDRLIGPDTMGIVGVLGYALLALLICLSPRALAPAARAVSENPRAAEKAASQARLGATS